MTDRVQIRLTGKQRRELIAAVEAKDCSIGKSSGAIYGPDGKPTGLLLETLIYTHGRRKVTYHWLCIHPGLMTTEAVSFMPEEVFDKGSMLRP